MVFDPNIRQELSSSCAIKCQQLILRDYGINVSEKDLRDIASLYGWYTEEEGVFMRNNGKLLGCFGIDYHHSQGNTIWMLKEELSKRHCVMVNLNHVKLSGEIVAGSYSDEACHAVIVSQVVIGRKGTVSVINPASGQVNQKCKMRSFLSAWEDSKNYMLATNIPALYKYDIASKSMKKIIQ